MKFENLKILRQEKGYSQLQLAKKLGIKQSFLSQIEAGKAKLPDRYMEKICLLLDISIDKLNEEKEIDDVLLEISVDIIDSIIDASDITKQERLNLLQHTYAMVEESYTKNQSIEDLEKEVTALKKNINKEVEEIKLKKNLFKRIFKTTKIKQDHGASQKE